ncbi:hypothetical protein PSTT_04822 [Puccinia striiformis]|uniref:Uncharacterized protein n=1 Tax=Puccinia striiformis TaxID=27350 RepID=A0A2S4VR91_9BASI|nr:hypothetical protein PSTT_04822 [Puccinia striiformis]
MNIPTFLNHISPNLLNSTPIPRPKPPTRPLIPINLISNPLGLSYDNDVLHRNVFLFYTLMLPIVVFLVLSQPSGD